MRTQPCHSTNAKQRVIPVISRCFHKQKDHTFTCTTVLLPNLFFNLLMNPIAYKTPSELNCKSVKNMKKNWKLRNLNHKTGLVNRPHNMQMRGGFKTVDKLQVWSMAYPFHTSVRGRYTSATPTGTPKFTQTIILCPNLLPIHVDKSSKEKRKKKKKHEWITQQQQQRQWH